MTKIKMPSAYTTLFIIIIVISVFTWIIPAGKYLYKDDGEPISGSYHEVERSGQTLGDVAMSPLNGLYEGIDVAAFILMVGGFLGVMAKTGSIDAGISSVVKKLKGREQLLIPILMGLFALGGTTFGMAEETIAFYPLVVPIVISAGYDTITAVSIILLGAGAGVLGSTVNPFATGIASGFSGVSLGDGILIRVLILLSTLGVAIWYVLSYAKKVKRDPMKSLVADMHEQNLKHFSSIESESKQLTSIHKTALTIFGVTFLIMVYSVIPFEDIGIPIYTLGWWFPQLSALFFVSAIILGIICRLKEKHIIDGFVTGSADLLGVAFIIGISRGITVIMNAGNITDTILHWGEIALSGTGSIVFLVLTYVIYIPLSFLIPSSSGLATLSMPIMSPLADFANIGRDLVITSFQSANGLVNLVTPTSAVVMGGLAIGRIPYERWIKYIWKLLAIIVIINTVFLVVGVVI